MSDARQYDLDPVPRSRSGDGGPKFAKMADFKVYLLRHYASNQKTNGEL